MISSVDALKAEEAARKLAEEIARACGEEGQVTGPADAPVARVKDIYRKLVYAKASKYSTLIDARDAAERLAENSGIREVQIQFDFS